MTHDPYQSNPAFAAYSAVTNSGLGNPFSSPFSVPQASAINPAALYNNPFAAQQLGAQGISGIPNYAGATAQQWPGSTPFTGVPFAGGWQNPNTGNLQNQGILQNPLLIAALQNPLLAFALQAHNPMLNPMAAHIASQIGSQPYPPFQQAPYPQQQNPYAQQPSPYAQQQNPFVQQQNPFVQQQNPYAQQQNPFTPQQQNPFAPQQNPYAQQHQQQIGQALAALAQQVSPFAQYNYPGAQFNSPLAPQSWVGQGVTQGGQMAGGFGQANPVFAQFAARGLQGASPWSGF